MRHPPTPWRFVRGVHQKMTTSHRGRTSSSILEASRQTMAQRTVKYLSFPTWNCSNHCFAESGGGVVSFQHVGVIFLRDPVESPGNSSAEGRTARKRSWTQVLLLDDAICSAQTTVVRCPNRAGAASHRPPELGWLPSHARRASPLVLR